MDPGQGGWATDGVAERRTQGPWEASNFENTLLCAKSDDNAGPDQDAPPGIPAKLI